jgi:hypothetical protein
MAAQAGVAPASSRLTGGRITLIRLSIEPGSEFRVYNFESNKLARWQLETPNFKPVTGESWSARQDLHLRSLGPKPSALLLRYALRKSGGITLREATGWGCAGLKPWKQSRNEALEKGGPEGSCTLNPPADNGALC